MEKIIVAAVHVSRIANRKIETNTIEK